jgi:hypothetical protein
MVREFQSLQPFVDLLLHAPDGYLGEGRRGRLISLGLEFSSVDVPSKGRWLLADR